MTDRREYFEWACLALTFFGLSFNSGTLPLTAAWMASGLAVWCIVWVVRRGSNILFLPICWMAVFFALSNRERLSANPLVATILVPAVVFAVLAYGMQFRRTRPDLTWFVVSCVLAGALGFASGEGGGPESMYSFWEDWGFTQLQAELVTHFIRKTIHFVFYGVVGWTFFRGMMAAKRDSEELAGLLKWAAGLAMLWVLVNAGFDEYRQYSTPNRTGQISDVALDLAGAGTFIGLSVLRGRRRESRRETRSEGMH